MALTPIQIFHINSELREWDIRIGIATKGMKKALNRLKTLRDKDLSIEYVFIDAQMVEHLLKMILSAYLNKRRILKALGENDPFEDCKLSDVDDEPLGMLIGKLKYFIGKTKLVEDLSKLNELRREIVHDLFNGNKDIKETENRAKDFISGQGRAEILNGLKEITHKIDAEISAIAEQSGIKIIRAEGRE